MREDTEMGQYQITRDKFLTADERKAILKASQEMAALDLLKGRKRSVQRYLLVDLALRSGLRVSEIANLKIGDIRLNGKDNVLFVRHGKRNKSRDVYVDGELAKHLKQYLKIKKESWREAVDQDSYLLSNGNGKNFTTTNLHISFKIALLKAGITRKLSIHSARHSYATCALASSNNLRFVQKQLGHANIAFTSLYADIEPETNNKLANTFTL